jgi:dienelactone hydrolase
MTNNIKKKNVYGVNGFIKEQCQRYEKAGFDVFYPDMLGRHPFSYDEAKAAYDFFAQNVGFQVYQRINNLVIQLNEEYDNVFLLGFSVGATIAWRCCENSLCSGIVACYGSRIRDYTNLRPSCPTLLLFAKDDSFNVSETIHRLKDTPNLTMAELEAEHGFIDFYSEHYNHQASDIANKTIADFFNSYKH